MTRLSSMHIGTLLLSACLLAIPLAASAKSDLSEQRRDFQSARAAFERGKMEEFSRIADRLKGYPLHPYLEFDELRVNLQQRPDAEVAKFIADHADSPLAGRMRIIWLLHLANQRRWDKFIEIYADADSKDVELRCDYLNARLNTQWDDALWNEVEELWLAGKPQPDACDPVFDKWRDTGHMSREKIITRLERAMDRKELSLARWLSTLLPKEEQAWMDRMVNMSQNPAREIEKLQPAKGSIMNAAVFAYGVRRLARADIDKAEVVWERERNRYSLTGDQKNQVDRSLSLNRAFRRDGEASRRLADLQQRMPDADKDVRQWRVRAALWKQDWPGVIEAVDALPEKERSEANWKYWRARALEASGRAEESLAVFKEAAECRCYYGFLAAEHLGEPPSLDAAQVKVTKDEMHKAQALPAMVRVHELDAVGMTTDARREWRHTALSSTGPQLRAVAKLGYEFGWHDLVMGTLAKTEAVNDLELRFPTPYRDEVTSEARQRAMDDAFVYAVMRQESAFNANARSAVGAMGLMQLMPATAKATARQIKHALKDVREVLEVRNNIRLGTAHLKHLLDRYDGNRVYTMAAYNAGPGRVTRWLPSSGRVPADIWIASITFDETREYVKRILTYTHIYEWRLGRKPTPLSRMLPIVEASNGSAFQLSENASGEAAAAPAEVETP